MNYVAFSGGADSTALAILLHERGEEFELVFCDTAAELPETYETITRDAVTRPLVDAGMAKRDVLELCKKHDLLNPAYSWRTNVSCFCCPFQRKSDWRGLLRAHPYLYALAEQWEQRSMDWADEHREDGAHPRFTWNEGFTLRQLREADASQLRLFPEPEEEACSICRW